MNFHFTEEQSAVRDLALQIIGDKSTPEQLRELVFRGRIGEVSDVESPAHAVTYSWLNARLDSGDARPRATRLHPPM